ncbi:MAG: hypothetical protein ACRDJG_12725 [Actinomycetota bacterium]
MSRGPCYKPEEIALAVLALQEGHSLSQVSAELGRDRSGLLRVLKDLGYPTRPTRLSRQQRKRVVEQRIAAMRGISREEIKERILQLRHQTASSPTAARPSSLNPADP